MKLLTQPFKNFCAPSSTALTLAALLLAGCGGGSGASAPVDSAAGATGGTADTAVAAGTADTAATAAAVAATPTTTAAAASVTAETVTPNMESERWRHVTGTTRSAAKPTTSTATPVPTATTTPPASTPTATTTPVAATTPVTTTAPSTGSKSTSSTTTTAAASTGSTSGQSSTASAAPAVSLPSAVSPPTTSNAGTALDLTGYTQTLNETFGAFDITSGDGAGPWYAPVFPDYGQAPFQDPGGSPNTYPWSAGVQEILVQKIGGQWTGGTFQSVNAAGSGFSQALGYFEATMQVDGQSGTWPAFWLLSIDNLTDPSGPHAEIDAMEYYGTGSTNNQFIATAHIYKAPTDQNEPFFANTASNLSSAFHQYGVLITTQWVIVYFDRVEVARYPAYAESQKPMYMLLSHALNSVPNDSNTRTLKISSVKVYSLPK
jgi:beta-glucanase (GH16 family)